MKRLIEVFETLSFQLPNIEGHKFVVQHLLFETQLSPQLSFKESSISLSLCPFGQNTSEA